MVCLEIKWSSGVLEGPSRPILVTIFGRDHLGVYFPKNPSSGLSMAGVGPDTFAGVRARTKPYLFEGPDS